MCCSNGCYLDPLVFYWLTFGCLIADFEGKADNKIRVLEAVEELKAQRADKQVSVFVVVVS